MAVLDAPAEFTERTADDAASWVPSPILERLASSATVPTPAIVYRDDGHGILYPGLVHALNSEPEAGKSLLCAVAACSVLRDGGTVMFLDFEMNEATFVDRLRHLGATDADLARFLYARPEVPILPSQSTLETVAVLEPALIIFDSMNEALGLEGLDPNSTTDVTLWIRRIPRFLANATGAAVLYTDHVAKSSENRGRWAIGSQAKLSAVDVAFTMKNERPFGKGRAGQSSVTVQKDRYGDLRGLAVNGKLLAQFVLNSTDDGSLDAELQAPADAGEFRPTFLMERVSRFLEESIEPQSSRKLEGGVDGKNDYIRRARDQLVTEGNVTTEPGPRGAILHRSVRPFRKNDRAPRPDRAPARPGRTDDRAPAPPPLRGGADAVTLESVTTSFSAEVVESP